MNYLAHAYLSFGHADILAGNLFSDYIKGKKQFEYPPPVQYGIRLHRLIDEFTDTHPVTLEAKKVFKPAVGLYAGAFMDVVYDHFLALDQNEFPGGLLDTFAAQTYLTLHDYTDIMPPTFARLFPYMQQYDWLSNYRHTWAIHRSFQGITERAKYLSTSERVFDIFLNEYSFLQNCYSSFFPQLKRNSADIFATFNL